jgi:predicted amidohydrolase YtcJ
MATAMAVRDGKIVAIGKEEDVSGYVTPRTRVLDLQGLTVLPGLIDVHTHVMQWAKAIVRGEIDAGHKAVHSIAEITKAVADRAQAVPEGQWILAAIDHRGVRARRCAVRLTQCSGRRRRCNVAANTSCATW